MSQIKAIVTVVLRGKGGAAVDTRVIGGSSAPALAYEIGAYLDEFGPAAQEIQAGGDIADFKEIVSHTVTLLPDGF